MKYNNFPAFCATLFASYTILENLLFKLAKRVLSIAPGRSNSIADKQLLLRPCRIIAGLIASSLSFTLLNAKESKSDSSQTRKTSTQPYADEKPGTKSVQVGRTLDFTLLVSVRAIEALVGTVWRRHRQQKLERTFRASNVSLIGSLIDPAIFMISAGTVMWTWVYQRERLPKDQQKWIGEAAAIDERLVEALRRFRKGELLYGKDTGQAELLQSMCKDFEWPLVWGDPAITIPIPCEMVHQGTGPSCLYFALFRFWKTFKFAMATYLPIQLIVKMREPSLKALTESIRESSRSSAFLGSAIGLFYYATCLARTVLGPRLFSYKTITPQMWDGGLCVAASCSACGLSIFLEKSRRRPELAFFMAPRAAAVFFPRRYDVKYLWRERLAFAMSAAALLTMVEEDPKSVRGLVSLVLSKILA